MKKFFSQVRHRMSNKGTYQISEPSEGEYSGDDIEDQTIDQDEVDPPESESSQSGVSVIMGDDIEQHISGEHLLNREKLGQSLEVPKMVQYQVGDSEDFVIADNTQSRLIQEFKSQLDPIMEARKKLTKARLNAEEHLAQNPLKAGGSGQSALKQVEDLIDEEETEASQPRGQTDDEEENYALVFTEGYMGLSNLLDSGPSECEWLKGVFRRAFDFYGLRVPVENFKFTNKYFLFKPLRSLAEEEEEVNQLVEDIKKKFAEKSSPSDTSVDCYKPKSDQSGEDTSSKSDTDSHSEIAKSTTERVVRRTKQGRPGGMASSAPLKSTTKIYLKCPSLYAEYDDLNVSIEIPTPKDYDESQGNLPLDYIFEQMKESGSWDYYATFYDMTLLEYITG